jgi:hypothetical protein
MIKINTTIYHDELKPNQVNILQKEIEFALNKIKANMKQDVESEVGSFDWRVDKVEDWKRK